MGYLIDLRQNYPIYALTTKNDTFRNDTTGLLMKGTNLGNSNKDDRPSQNNKGLHLHDVVEADQQKLSQNNVMLIDDEPDMLFTYKLFLDNLGYGVDTFTDPMMALQHYAKSDPSYYKLIVMDIRMPHMNGLQLYHRLKAINSEIQILFVSALDAAEEMMSLLPEINMNDILRKPIDEKVFVEKVKRKCVACN
jgi:CheY-like chemotaxis protein